MSYCFTWEWGGRAGAVAWTSASMRHSMFIPIRAMHRDLKHCIASVKCYINSSTKTNIKIRAYLPISICVINAWPSWLCWAISNPNIYSLSLDCAQNITRNTRIDSHRKWEKHSCVKAVCDSRKFPMIFGIIRIFHPIRKYLRYFLRACHSLQMAASVHKYLWNFVVCPNLVELQTKNSADYVFDELI